MLSHILDRQLDKTSCLEICLGYYISLLIGFIFIFTPWQHNCTELFGMWAKLNMIDPYSGLEMLRVESLLVPSSFNSKFCIWEEEMVFVLPLYLILGVGYEPDSSILFWID
jgi:hypothetical protein